MHDTKRANRNGATSKSIKQAHNGLKRQHVAEVQRARILAAMTEVASEQGASNVTVAHVVERAGVSRRTFYELFDDCEGCLLAAIDECVARATERVLSAYDAGKPWRERTRAGLSALLRFIDTEPSQGRLLIVETLAAGRASLQRRSRVLSRVADAIAVGDSETAKAASVPTRLTAEGTVGAVLAVIHSRLLEERPDPLSDLLNPLMSMIVMPYLGPAAARRELQRPPGKTVPTRPAANTNPLKELGIRLTYRTVRVLTAIATHPGASNRTIADASEITDQGQISKLLTRLEKLGLVHNTTNTSTSRGEPNAWTLTQQGWQIHTTLGEHTTRA